MSFFTYCSITYIDRKKVTTHRYGCTDEIPLKDFIESGPKAVSLNLKSIPVVFPDLGLKVVRLIDAKLLPFLNMETLQSVTIARLVDEKEIDWDLIPDHVNVYCSQFTHHLSKFKGTVRVRSFVSKEQITLLCRKFVIDSKVAGPLPIMPNLIKFGCFVVGKCEDKFDLSCYPTLKTLKTGYSNLVLPPSVKKLHISTLSHDLVVNEDNQVEIFRYETMTPNIMEPVEYLCKLFKHVEQIYKNEECIYGKASATKLSSIT